MEYEEPLDLSYQDEDMTDSLQLPEPEEENGEDEGESSKERDDYEGKSSKSSDGSFRLGTEPGLIYSKHTRDLALRAMVS